MFKPANTAGPRSFTDLTKILESKKSLRKERDGGDADMLRKRKLICAKKMGEEIEKMEKKDEDDDIETYVSIGSWIGGPASLLPS